MKLSVLIPVYNEEMTIDALLTAVVAVDIEKEVIVVNDCSTDGTAAVLEGWRDQVRMLSHPTNRGKGAAVRTALAAATGSVVVVQDADLHRQVELRRRGQFLDGHLKRTITGYVDHQRIGTSDLRPERGWEAEAHGTQTTRADEASRVTRQIV